jgi:hypothetical protein
MLTNVEIFIKIKLEGYMDKINIKYMFIIFLILIFCSCVNKKFDIKLEKNDYIQINNLMKEIYDRALNNDIDYFRIAVNNISDKEFIDKGDATEYYNIFRIVYQDENLTDEEIDELQKQEWTDLLKILYKKEHYSDEEIIEYDLVEQIKSLIYKIIKANIVKTYRNKAEYSNYGINFNYCIGVFRV